VLTLEQLRELAERLPDGAALTLPKAALLEALAGGSSQTSAIAPAPPGDRTVAELAVQFHRKPSTVRGWLEAGRFPGAYKLRDRDWRVPAAALDAFLAQERAPRPARGARLSAWRQRRGLA
jgi:helix-turn-helix protein